MTQRPTIDESTDVQDDGTDRRSFLAGTGALAAGVVTGGTSAAADDRVGTRAVRFDGVEHRLLDEATAEVQDGSLVVSGFGDSGGDGIAAMLGQATEWLGDGETRAEMPVGSTLTATTVGTVDGESGQVATRIDLTREGEADFVVEWDYPVAEGSLAVEVLDGSEVVHFEEVENGGQVAVQPPQPAPPDFFTYTTDGELAALAGGVAPASCTNEFAYPDGEVTVDVDGTEHTGTRFRVLEDTREQTAEAWYVSEYRLTGTGIDRLVVDGETVDPGVMFADLANNPVGDATLTRHPDALEVANVASGDGFYADLGSVEGAGFAFDGVQTDTPGAAISVQALATVDVCGKKTFGVAELRDEGGDRTLSGGFPDELETDAVRVDVREDGSLVGREVVAEGDLGVFGESPTVRQVGVLPTTPTGYGFLFDDSVEVQLGSGTQLAGNEIRVAPSDPELEVLAVHALGVDGDELEGIVVRDEVPMV